MLFDQFGESLFLSVHLRFVYLLDRQPPEKLYGKRHFFQIKAPVLAGGRASRTGRRLRQVKTTHDRRPGNMAKKKSLPFRERTHKILSADYFSASAAGAASAAFSQAVESQDAQAVESQAAAGAAASTAVVSAASPSAAAFELALPQQLTIAAAARTTTKVKIFFILFKSFKNASNINIRGITSKFFRPILQNP